MEKDKLIEALVAIFKTMGSYEGDGDRYFADEFSTALKDFILTGEVATLDKGTTPAGSYRGVGTGKMLIDSNNLGSALYDTFINKIGNDALAEWIATTIDDVCKVDDTIKGATVGMLTPPSGTSVPFAGTSKGKFEGDKSFIEMALRACFSTMNSMLEGGDAYFAEIFADTVYTYLISGKVETVLDPPFTEGGGTGVIA
ncbi:MAG: hypothetical protein LBO67_04850 [Spirochaetaceae bacterium]|jgi:hypothetical protein|nr:hypothetical protein [Spirochaetaceae bacterium]